MPTLPVGINANRATAGAAQFARAAGVIRGQALSTSVSLRGLATGFVGVTGAIVAMRTAIRATNLAGQFQEQQISLRRLLGDQQRANDLLGELRQRALATGQSFDQMSIGARRLAAVGLAETNEQMLEVLDTINDTVAAIGDPQAFRFVVKAFGDIRAEGRLLTRELMQLANAGVPGREIIAQGLGITTRELSEQLRRGAVDADTAIRTLLDGLQERFGGAVREISEGWLGTIRRMRETTDDQLRQIGDSLAKNLGFEDAGSGIISAIERAGEAVRGIIESMPGGSIEGLISGFARVLEIAESIARILRGPIGVLAEWFGAGLAVIGGVASIGADFVDHISGNTEEMKKLREAMEKAREDPVSGIARSLRASQNASRDRWLSFSVREIESYQASIAALDRQIRAIENQMMGLLGYSAKNFDQQRRFLDIVDPQVFGRRTHQRNAFVDLQDLLSGKRTTRERLAGGLDASLAEGLRRAGLFPLPGESIESQIANIRRAAAAEKKGKLGGGMGRVDDFFTDLRAQRDLIGRPPVEADQYKALQDLRKAAEKEGVKVTEDMELATKRYVAEMHELNKAMQMGANIGDSLGNALTDAVHVLAEGGENIKDAFLNILRGIGRDLIDIGLEPVRQAFRQFFASLFTGFVPVSSAMGNVFQDGRVVRHSFGGVVDQPSAFALRDGGIGTIAENEPEGILPLKRGPTGRLGVEATGAGATTTNYYNVRVYPRDFESFRRSRRQVNDAVRRSFGG